MKVKDLMTITAYLSGTTDKPLKVQVTNADGTKQNCDIKDVTQYSDALVLNVETDFFFKESQNRKFKVGDFVIHKDDGQDIIWKSHKVIQVDELDCKYRLDNGSVIHFSEADEYETTSIPSDEEKASMFIPTIEQIKSVYAAAGVMEQMNEHTDAKNLNELWESLKKYHQKFNTQN